MSPRWKARSYPESDPMSKSARRPRPRKRAATALVRRLPPPPAGDDHGFTAFERLSRDKSIDAEKLGKLIALQEHIMRVNAEAAFNRAYTAMVLEIPEIDRRGKILNKENKVQSHYSKHEDIQRIVKPILKAHGFSLSYESSWPLPGMVKVVGVLTHQDGHARRSEFMGAADTSGNKNAIQALGSTVSYGRRYTTIDLLNITSKGLDDDGQKAGREAASPTYSGPTTTVVDIEHVVKAGVVKAGVVVGRRAPSGEIITQKQRQRLYIIAKNSGRSEADVKSWLMRRFGWGSSREITRDVYDLICTTVESPGELVESPL